MEFQDVIIDQIHIFSDQSFGVIKEFIEQSQIYIVKKKINNNSFFLIKKGEKFNKNSKESFINRSENSFRLIHTSILNIAGFSIEKPYLYYKYVKNPQNINKIELSDVNIQKMFLGVASGLSYLLSKGYYYDDFTINSIVFDENNCPKLFNYINFDESNKNYEEDLVIRYVEIVKMILNKKKKQDAEIVINDKLISLIDISNQKVDFPSLKDFINFFESISYRKDFDITEEESFQKYLNIFKYTDKIIYNEDKEIQFESSWLSSFHSSTEKIEINSIEQVCKTLYKKRDSFFFFFKQCSRLFTVETIYLNILPEYYIKPLVNRMTSLSKKVMKYLYCDDLASYFPDFKKIIEKNNQDPFICYIEIMKQIKQLEDKKNAVDYFDKSRKLIDKNIELYRMQAIDMLKKAYKNSNNAKIKIELAMQYINGSILPHNLKKSLDILNSIAFADKQTQELINQMINKIKLKMKTSANILTNLPQEQSEIIQKAKSGDVLSLMYTGFSLYTGFNGFPIIHSLSVYYYRKAAKTSQYAMYILGYLYLNGIIFPRNFRRARNCFKRAADAGYLKAEIIDGILRKHLYRSYLTYNFSINKIINHYLPSFKSMIPNDSLVLPRIIYLLEANYPNKYVNSVKLNEDENELLSEKKDEICSMSLEAYKSNFILNISESFYSGKKILSSKKIDKTNLSKEELCKIGKSYFNGDNNYPINYSKAIKYFKLSADKGDSEAQWRYAIMCQNSIGKQSSIYNAGPYYKKSAEQNNLQGKFLYALFLRENGDNEMFEHLINECCISESHDAMYYYALHLENLNLSNSINYYQRAADKGHLDSLIRLIYYSKRKFRTDLYDHYLKLSAGIINDVLLEKLIHFYDKNKEYDQSNILIQIGLKINYKLFNIYYCDHLLYGKGMQANEDKAGKLAFFAYKKVSQNEKYIYIILDIFIRQNNHNKAVKFLLQNKSQLTTKHRKKFLSFYKKLDKNIANENLITINFCYEDYQDCRQYLIELKKENGRNFIRIFEELDFKTKVGNYFAMIILGRFYKNGNHVSRDLIKAVQYFSCAAEKKCPEGYYYIGKEYFYGRILDQDFELAKKYLLLALENNGEPRAGYYLYKIPNIYNDERIDDVNALKISASFGYKRALYKYGHRLITGKDDRIIIDKIKGYELIKQSAKQNYKKAIKFYNSHDYHNINNKNTSDVIIAIENENDSNEREKEESCSDSGDITNFWF